METLPEETSFDEAAMHYRTHRNSFIGWAKRHLGADQEEAKDAFSEAICTYYELKRNGRLDGFKGEVRTYLFAIGRNQLLTRIRSKRIAGNHSVPYAIHIEGDRTVDAQLQLEREESVQQVLHELERLSMDDRRVLELYYIERQDMHSIAEAMGYKNSNVAKKKKCIALKRLMDALHRKVVTKR